MALGSPDRYFALKAWGFRLLGALRLYERAHFRYLAKQILPGDRALDLGAHFGVYTRLFSRAVGAHGQVIAVEPFPPCVARLKAMAERRRNVEVVQAAIGSKAGSLLLRVPLLGGLVPEPALARIEGMEGEADTWPGSGEVDVLTLETIVSRHGPMDILKVDVEGQDPVVLEGLLRLPLEVLPRLVMIECWDLSRISHLLIDLRQKADFEAMKLVGNKLVPLVPNDRVSGNIYLIRQTDPLPTAGNIRG